jgi:endoglucanase
MTFQIHRGTNISEWLSQSSQRSSERAAFFTESDVRRIASLGFDHIRLPVNDIAWANWDYKGGFAPLIRNGTPSEIVDTLMA